MTEPRSSRLPAWLLSLSTFIVLAAAVLVVYGRAIDDPFIFDDQWSIQENSSIVRLSPLVGDKETPGPLNPPADLPTSGRPLVNLSFALNYHFDELAPRYYRAVNILLHLLSAALLAAIVRRTLEQPRFAGRFDKVAWPLALLVALVWALHPLQTESVVYVTQRTELLMGLCYLATLYASIRHWSADTRASQTVWLIIAILACLAGMASKEVMVSAPLVVLLYDRAFVSGSFAGALRRSWPLYLGLAAGWLLLLLLNYQAPRSSSAGFHLGTPGYVWWLTQTKVLLIYLKLVVWPWPLVIHYAIAPIESVAAALPWLVPVTLLALGTLSLLYKNFSSGFLATTVWLILAPTLVVPVLTEFAAERRMYLPLAALVTLVIVGSYTLLSGRLRHPLAVVAVASVAWLVALGTLSAKRLSAYEDELTLWQDALQHESDDVVVRNNLGVSLLSAGRLNEALEHLEKARNLEPNHAETFYNLGNAMVDRGERQTAVGYFEEAIQLKPAMAIAHYNLGNVLIDLDRPQDAIEHLQTAVQLKPDFADAHNNLASALRRAGRLPDAIAQLQQAVKLKPPYTEAWANLASAAADAGQPDVAVAAGEEALRLAKHQGKSTLATDLEAWLNSYRSSQSLAPPTPASPPGH